MRDLGIDTKSISPGTAVSPADHSYQGHRVILGWIRGHQRSPTVSLTGVLPSLLEPGAQHVVRHGGVHPTAVSVREDRHPDLVEVGGQVAARGDSTPAGDYRLSGEESPGVRETGRLDVGVHVERDVTVQLQHGDVVLQVVRVVARMLLDGLDLHGEGDGLELLVQRGVAEPDHDAGGGSAGGAVSGGHDVLPPDQSSSANLPLELGTVGQERHLQEYIIIIIVIIIIISIITTTILTCQGNSPTSVLTPPTILVSLL